MTALLTTFVISYAAGQLRVEPEKLGREHHGQRVVVEGKYNGRIGKDERLRLRLRNCAAKFVPEAPSTVANLRGNTNVEFTGVVRVERSSVGEEELLVHLERVKELPDDAGLYQERANQIAKDDFDAWYELSRWAESRFARYGDPALKDKGYLAYYTGINVQRRAAAGDPQKLRAVVERIRRDKKMVDYSLAPMEHEILRAEFAKAPPQSIEELNAFAQRVHEQLVPPTGGVVPPLPVAERGAYDRDPLPRFAVATEATRAQMARYWEVALRQRAFELEFERSGKDPLAAFQIGERASETLAGYPELAQAWFDRGLEGLSGRIGNLTRREVQTAAALLARHLGDQATADRVRKNWLHTQEQQLRALEADAEQKAVARGLRPPAKDARTRLELATAHLDWFPNDNASRKIASRLLTEALAVDPSLNQAEAKLRQLGFQPTRSGEWRDATTAKPGETAPTLGEIRIGDRAERVRDVLGEPTNASRVVTRDWIVHTWEYETGQRARRVYVMRESRKDGQARVSAIHTLK